VTTHSDWHERLGLHALGALDAGDSAALEAHLADCPGCRQELADLRESAAELARGARPVLPSPEVTRRILDAAHAEPRRRSPRAAEPVRPVRPVALPPRRWRVLPIAASIAAGAVLAGLVVSHLTLLRRLDRAATMLARGREFVEFIASPDVVTVPLVAGKAVPGARALVAYDHRSARVVLLAFNLPPPPAGEIYQLWGISDGVRPAGVFSPDVRGGTLVGEHWSPEPGQIPMFAVTLEPAPGMPDPTGKILLLGGRPEPR
jgi:anti-sigma-K factor RskA